MLRSPILSAVPGIVHAFTTRAWFVPPPPPDVGAPAQVAPLLAALGTPGGEPAMLDQVHGARVLPVEPGGPRWPVGSGDALVCTVPGVVAYVRVADCVPILVAGPRGVAAIHAGWRGTAAGVIQAAVAALVERSGHAPEELVAAIGPAIGPCCYEVGPEVVAALGRYAPPELFVRARPARRPTVDLRALDVQILRTLGVRGVDVMDGCTCCDLRFHSFRRDGARTGRQAGLIGLLR
jgi:YfiH family protein